MTPNPHLEQLIEYHRKAYQEAERELEHAKHPNVDIEAHFAYMAVLEKLQDIEIKYRIDILPSLLQTAYEEYKRRILRADEYHAEQEFKQRMDTIEHFEHWMHRVEIIELNGPLFNPLPN